MFYHQAPVGDSSLADLEEICCRRLLVLRQCLASAHSNAKLGFGEQSRDSSGEEKDENAVDDDDHQAAVRNYLFASKGRVDGGGTDQQFLSLNGYPDEVGHFTLRVALAGKYSCWKAWVYAEAALFARRLGAMNTDQVTDFLWTHRHTHAALSFLPKDRHSVFLLAWRYKNGDDRESFTALFRCVPELVASRSVPLSGGLARVKCSYLGRMLQNAFFDELWHCRVQSHKAYTQAVTDHRLPVLFWKLQELVQRHFISSRRQPGPGSAISLVPQPLHPSLVDGLSCLFPPCMRHLHRTLRRQHRLDHHARIQYSLYLKRIGLGAEDALQFWREEYSKTPSCCHGSTTGCTHRWQTDGRRYTYNIRHLYGLEGSCRNYGCFSCRHMIDESGSASGAGGCPFRYFDRRHLATLLSLYGISEQDVESVVQELDTAGSEVVACTRVLSTAWQNHRTSHAISGKAGVAGETGVELTAAAAPSPISTTAVQSSQAMMASNGLCLEVETDSEDDTAFLSRLSERPSVLTLAGSIVGGAADMLAKSPEPGIGHKPGGAALVEAPPEAEPVIENFKSPVDFFQSYQKLLGTCSGCSGAACCS